LNEALSLRITIRGSGNLPLLGEPEVSFPPDHDLYDVTRTVNTTTSGNRISGSVIFEYPVVARHAGKFRIAPVQFSWFDPGSGTYRTESTSEFNFTVVKGEGGTSGAGSVYIPGLTVVQQHYPENRGVAAGLVEDALEEAAVDWMVQLEGVAERKFGVDAPGDRRELTRRGRFLEQRGFPVGLIRRYLDRSAV